MRGTNKNCVLTAALGGVATAGLLAISASASRAPSAAVQRAAAQQRTAQHLAEQEAPAPPLTAPPLPGDTKRSEASREPTPTGPPTYQTLVEVLPVPNPEHLAVGEVAEWVIAANCGPLAFRLNSATWLPAERSLEPYAVDGDYVVGSLQLVAPDRAVFTPRSGGTITFRQAVPGPYCT